MRLNPSLIASIAIGLALGIILGGLPIAIQGQQADPAPAADTINEAPFVFLRGQMAMITTPSGGHPNSIEDGAWFVLYDYDTDSGINSTTAVLWKVDRKNDTIKAVSKWNLTADGIANGQAAAEMQDYK